MVINEQTILRYLNNISTEEEAIAVHALLTGNPEILETYLPLEEVANVPTQQLDPAITRRLWYNIQSKAILRTANVFKSRFVRTVAAAAATIAVFIYVYKAQEPAVIKRTESRQPISKVTAPQVKKARVNNATQSVQNVLLEEGSMVKLYPQGSLEYDKPFGKTSRDIFLKGKAFFDVKKQQAKPFVVTTAFVSITVLGTRFTVDQAVRNNKDEVIVRLFTGSIMLTHRNKKDKPVYMKPGETMHVDKYGLNIVLPRKKASSNATPEVMEFKEAPLGQVLPLLEKYFAITVIRSNRDIDNIMFTGSFRHTEKPASILQAIALASGLVLLESDDGFVLKQE